MQAAIICSQATLVFVLKKKENGEEKGGKEKGNKWTYLSPKAPLLRLIYQKEKKNSF